MYAFHVVTSRSKVKITQGELAESPIVLLPKRTSHRAKALPERKFRAHQDANRLGRPCRPGRARGSGLLHGAGKPTFDR
eukprot:5528021-Pyramimonas_sp.AAC.2